MKTLPNRIRAKLIVGFILAFGSIAALTLPGQPSAAQSNSGCGFGCAELVGGGWACSDAAPYANFQCITDLSWCSTEVCTKIYE